MIRSYFVPACLAASFFALAACPPASLGATAQAGNDPCSMGSEGCACTAEGACDTGLSCFSELCVDASGSGITTAMVMPQ